MAHTVDDGEVGGEGGVPSHIGKLMHIHKTHILINKYVERIIPGQYVSMYYILFTDGVLVGKQLNLTLSEKNMFNKNVFNNNCFFSQNNKDFTS